MSLATPADLWWRLESIYHEPGDGRRWAALTDLIVEWTPEAAQARFKEAGGYGEVRKNVISLRERMLERRADTVVRAGKS